VRSFKVGPDYIDPGFLSRAAGRAVRNLDAWLLDAPTVRWAFWRHAGADGTAIVEGMMGLFDGLTGLDDSGSTAHVARLLDLPVLVVLDASRAARSIAAVARGCQVLDRRVRIAGWILNRVAGETHRRWVAEAVERATGRPVLGSLADDARLALPERHLGLVQARETRALGRLLGRLARAVDERVDVARLLAVTRAASTHRGAPAPQTLAHLLAAAAGRRRGQQAVIAWACDAAFTFHYADNVELLEALGARVAPWSPLDDRRLPARTAAVVIGGGYPELFAPALADNRAALEAVRAFAGSGGPVYGECGGLMYLARGIVLEGRRHRMAGIVPAWVRLAPRARVAYVRAKTVHDTILAPRGTVLRGHEFHTSVPSPAPSRAEAAYRVVDAADGRPRTAGRFEGYHRRGVLASYVHLNFLSDPRLAARLVASARDGRRP